MKNMNRKIVASIISLTMLSSSVYAMPSDSGKSVSYRELVGSTAGTADAIKAEMKNYNVLVDSGVMSSHDAVSVLAKNLVEKGVGFADIDAYVQSKTTRAEYKSFKSGFQIAMAGIDTNNMTSAEMTQVMAQSMAPLNKEGLSWSGCGGVAVGAVLLVAAVVVGIVAIVKSQTATRLTAQYQSQMADRTTQYNNDYGTLQASAALKKTAALSNTKQLASNIARLNTVNDEIKGAGPGDPNMKIYQAEALSLTAANQDLTKQNNQLELDIASLSAQMDALAVQYNQDEASFKMAEDTSPIPNDRAFAKNMGIGAGIGAGIGLYLIIDGAHGGGC